MSHYLYSPLHYSSALCPDQGLSTKALQATLRSCRRQTLGLVEGITPQTFCAQAHPDFSPVGWHLGHIAYTESLWVVEHLAGLPKQFPQYERLFAADGLPKSERQNLPALDEILVYLQAVRSQTFDYLYNIEPYNDSSIEAVRLWYWLIQHESQHAETIAMVLAMHQINCGAFVYSMVEPAASLEDGMVRIEAGSATVGSDEPEAIDNERPAHLVSTESYWIDRDLVTYGQYQRFIDAGGYQTAQWWSQEGWQWLRSSLVDRPLYGSSIYSLSKGLDKTALDDATWSSHPVCGVSWYEADAYARFVGKRLPTEAEWEKAASKNECDRAADSIRTGCVWEWTDTWFSAYLGFQPFPYQGYSQIYFDEEHRVLKGGSWATPEWVRRPSFRNWYHPHRREVFAGFRCAR